MAPELIVAVDDHSSRFPGGMSDDDQVLRAELENEDALVQPFLPGVAAEGEVSVVAIAGRPRHAVRKRAPAGEWRVQYEFGGTVEPIALDGELVGAADAVLGALDAVPLYARVDLARHDGRLLLMELELIEPNLFFDLVPESAPFLADALASLLTAGPPATPASTSPSG